MFDAAYPPSPALVDQLAGEGVKVAGWYLGAAGATPHVWTPAEVAALAPKIPYGLPIWVEPFGSANGVEAGDSAAAAAHSRGLPIRSAIMLDVESSQAQLWTAEELDNWSHRLDYAGFTPVVYGNAQTLGNARTAGVPAILASWVSSGSWPSSLPAGAAGWQWQSLPAEDLDVVSGTASNAQRWSIGQPLPLAPTDPALARVASNSLPPVPQSPCVGIAPGYDGGYYVLDQHGHVMAFGARWWGSPAIDNAHLSEDWVAIAPLTRGYVCLSSEGNVCNYGAPWSGSPAQVAAKRGS